jgi:DNA-binding CsgD family transcriptional regulator
MRDRGARGNDGPMRSLAQSPRALRAFGALIAEGRDPKGFACAGVRALAAHIGSDLTTLSDCDLVTGRRRVLGDQSHRLGPEAIDAFDRYFRGHPLVGFHATHPHAGSHRISDAVPRDRFRRTPLYNEYYRMIGIHYAVAVPLYVDGMRLVSFVLNRAHRDFSDDECAELDFLRAPLSALYRQVIDTARLRPEFARADESSGAALTPREAEVMQWVTAGKADAQIAAIVGASVRTVQKHLQNAYAKLGVEGRTAAAMRLMQARSSRAD